MTPELLGIGGLGMLLFGVVALHAGWSILARPQRGVLLLAALVPFDGLLLLVPHPGLIDGWKEGLVIVLVLAALLAPPAARSNGSRHVPAWLVAYGIIAVIGIVSAFSSISPQSMLAIKVNYFYLLLFFVIWRCPLDRTDRDRLVTILMATGAIVAVVGIVQQIVGPEALNQLGYEYNSVIRTTNGRLRSFSTFPQPFPFSLYLMMVLLACTPVALGDPRRPRNKLFLIGTPILLIGLLSGIVRSAMLGLAIGAVYLAVRKYRVLFAIAPLVIMGVLLVPGDLVGAVTSSSSLADRTTGWNAIVTPVIGQPVGLGIGTVGAAAQKTTESCCITGDAISEQLGLTRTLGAYQPDNYYIKMFVELGPIGLWLFATFLFLCWAYARRIGRRVTGDDEGLAIGISASVVGAAAASMAATYWEIFPLDLYFWLLVGVLVSIDLDSRAASNPRTTDPHILTS
jgi:hypothetical protein